MMSLFLLASVAGASAPPPPPELRRDAENRLIVDSPDTELVEYRLEFGPDALASLDAAARLDRLIGPNPFDILFEHKATGTVRMRTTVHGAFQLWNGSGWEHLRPRSVHPEGMPERPERCAETMLSLSADGSADPEYNAAFDSTFCAPAQYVDGLVIQGLDRDGRQLWVATAPDTRVVRPLMGPNGEPHGPPVLLSDKDLTASVQVPDIGRLSSVRWFETDGSGGLRLIGEGLWPAR